MHISSSVAYAELIIPRDKGFIRRWRTSKLGNIDERLYTVATVTMTTTTTQPELVIARQGMFTIYCCLFRWGARGERASINLPTIGRGIRGITATDKAAGERGFCQSKADGDVPRVSFSRRELSAEGWKCEGPLVARTRACRQIDLNGPYTHLPIARQHGTAFRQKRLSWI